MFYYGELRSLFQAHGATGEAQVAALKKTSPSEVEEKLSGALSISGC